MGNPYRWAHTYSSLMKLFPSPPPPPSPSLPFCVSSGWTLYQFKPLPEEVYPFPLNQPGAHLGQITICAKDAEPSIRFYRDVLGMKYLSRQDVGAFCLHFLAFTDKTQPDADVNAVANREWLWKQKFTQIEIQEDGQDNNYVDPTDMQCFSGMRFMSPNVEELQEYLKTQKVKVEFIDKCAWNELPALKIRDPTNIPIEINQMGQ